MIVTIQVYVDVELDLPVGPLSPDGKAMSTTALEAIKRSLGFSETVGWEHRLSHETTIKLLTVSIWRGSDVLDALANLYAECPLADYGDAIDLDLWEARENAADILKREGR